MDVSASVGNLIIYGNRGSKYNKKSVNSFLVGLIFMILSSRLENRVMGCCEVTRNLSLV